ncbi:MAG TPA: MopE-related protein [Candidatus Polarisedimenticolia bacterium]|nr:MopE-related protein [Candidatus Polarisedimenticolia bacterium]
MRPRATLIAIALLALAVPSLARNERSLSFEERVRAQEAIERIYYAHFIGATKRFEEVVPREVLERKVHLYLQESAALESVWRAPVTAAMLRGEAERIAASTRMPDRLLELFAALGNDPVLIQECLVRPVLVDRLARERFAAERSPESQSSRDATWDEWWAGVSAGLDEGMVQTVATAGDPLRDTWTSTVVRPNQAAAVETCPSGEAWNNGGLDQGGPGSRWGHTSVWTGSVMIAWGGNGDGVYLNTGERYDPITDSVTPTSITDAPSARADHVAVWTGDGMVIWGGKDQQGALSSGGVYDPVTDEWTTTSLVGAPPARYGPTAVWTGSRMIVWGGAVGATTVTRVNSGGLYDPSNDSWIPTSSVNAPLSRNRHTAVWTGTRMIIWGGSVQSGSSGITSKTGSRYDPATDTWTATSTVGSPEQRAGHSAVWTGDRMLIWGGISDYPAGGRYDPATDSWTPMSTIGAPQRRSGNSAIWTGTVMVVWGGSFSDPYNTGGRYDPVTDSWLSTSLFDAPQPSSLPTAVWTGTQMIVWGGATAFGRPNALVGRYEPEQDRWVSTLAWRPPTARERNTMVWTGTEMIVWGGSDTAVTNSGGRYDPVLDAWRPTSTVNAPLARTLHTAVWTGSEMIIWGGFTLVVGDTNTGGRYDPILDTWNSISTVGAPAGRQRHTAVWTGNVMIVWGGTYAYVNTGGRYDPVQDSWLPTTTAGAPQGRVDPLAFWTGTEMIVYAGFSPYTPFALGGRYDPSNDSWRTLSAAGAPTSGTAVWSGSEMIVWSGYGQTAQEAGGRYNPVTDLWAPVSRLNAPSARSLHTVVWADGEMIVWGGYVNSTNQYLQTGGRYDPTADSWEMTTTTGAPSPRAWHGAVWTGAEMIVWGGRFDTGGRYIKGSRSGIDGDGDTFRPCDGDCDDARPTVHPGAPELCDGLDNDCDGAIPANEADADGDGYRICGGDCDDAAPNVHPGGLEICDGVDNDCSGVIDDDADGDGYSVCDDDCDDTKAAIHPGAAEICDGLDTNCDGVLPLEELDQDQDGRRGCMGDCDDHDPYTRIGFPEKCDGKDNDCDGFLPTNERDDDGDGWRPCSVVCIDPYYRYCIGDCDDHNATVHPNASEICGDGLVNDCLRVLSRLRFGGGCGNPAYPLSYWNEEDCDHDGWSQCQGDCAPEYYPIHPGAMEACNSRDDDCNGSIDDGDADGDGSPICLDCRDYLPGVHPGATEICDGLDTNCDGVLPPDENDGDRDGLVVCQGDCDDTNPGVRPGGPEICDGLDNDCDGVIPPGENDGDLDAFSACQGDCDDSNAGIYPGALDIPGDPWDQDCAGGPTCDPMGVWAGHGAYISCVDKECTKLKKAGLLTGKQCDAIVSAAGTNQWGGP